MSLDPSALGRDIFNAMSNVFVEDWPEIRDYAESESKKLAASLVMIELLRNRGRIDREQARLHLEIQKNATRTVLLTIQGLGILSVERAINAALAVVAGAVNQALGFALI